MTFCRSCGGPLSPDARFCPSCGAAAEAAQPSEERKVATVIFADLVGSTELGEQDPERTRAMLDRFYDAMAAEVVRAGGTVEKFAGDAVMAAFGAPTALEDHAERALHAALAMRRRLADLFGGRLQLRIGVNTGEIVVGRAREGSSFVTGDAVNVCARLEQNAEPGEILVGERTVQAARGAFEFDKPSRIDAKGKPEGVVCRRLVRALSLMRPRGVPGLQRAFVGRERELAFLQAAYAEVVERGKPQLVTIVGDAGAGKTRLVQELWEWLGGQGPQPLRRTGRCLSYGKGTTYWPLGEVLKEHLGLLETDPPTLVLERLGTREILGLTLGLDVAGDLHPLAARDRLHDAWVELAEELVDGQSAVLVVEDIHWAEADLFDVLESTLERVTGPLLLLCTARPELLDVRPGWGGARRAASTLEVDALSDADAARMLTDLLAADLPEGVRAAIVARAEGNPFFLEELVGTLIDRGVLARETSGWHVHEGFDAWHMPDSARALVAARIDLLGQAEKAALQAAAVIGRVFWTRPIYELLPGADPDFRVLAERDFVRRRSGSSIARESEFVFKHQLTRDVAYGSLPKARRARLHAGFADWLERFGNGRDEHAALLAHHYGEAVRPEDSDLVWADDDGELARLRQKAVRWLRRAAHLGTGRYELRDAASLLQQALVLERDERTQIEILRELAFVNILNYDVESFRRGLEEALALDPDPVLAAEIYSLLALYGRGRPYMWKQPPPIELGEQWLERALALARPGSAARARALLARALAQPDAGAAPAAEAFEIAKTIEDPALITQSIEAHALVASVARRFAEAARWTDRAVDVLGEIPDPMPGHEHFQAAFVYLRAGRMVDAARHVAEQERATAALTPHDHVHAAAARALQLSATAGWEALAELAERAERAAEANVETPCQFNWRSLIVCALGRAHLGDEREARRLEELGRENAVVAGPAEREPALLRCALLRSDLDEAERILALLPARGGAWDVDGPSARLDALVALGDRGRVEEEAVEFLEEESYYHPFALRALGVVRGKRSLVEQAGAAFQAMGLEWHAAETGKLVAEL